jgi:hypothetical protein
VPARPQPLPSPAPAFVTAQYSRLSTRADSPTFDGIRWDSYHRHQTAIMSLWRRNQTRHDSLGTSSSSSNGSRKSSVAPRKQLFSGFVVKIDEDEPPRPKSSTLRKVQSLENHRLPVVDAAAALKEMPMPPPPAPVEIPRELPPPAVLYDVAIVGAGPAGLMLAFVFEYLLSSLTVIDQT